MIERRFVSEKMKEFQIQEFITQTLKNIGHSKTKVQRTPLGEKVIVYASRPGLVVGRKGQNIKKLTIALKKKFNLENPQIEISEVENIYLDAQIVAEMISSSLERFGSARFKGIGHKTMSEIMNAGALGVELIISGKIPSSRSKSWRFYQGYLKKCGDISTTGVNKAYANAQLKSGTVGIKVSIMPPTTKLPDHIELIEEKQEIIEEVTNEKPEEGKKESKEKPKAKKKVEKKSEEIKEQEAPKEEESAPVDNKENEEEKK